MPDATEPECKHGRSEIDLLAKDFSDLILLPSKSIVTGGNTILDPANIISLCKMNLLSRAGRCYSFDHRANGYAKGEGIGVIILKRLSDAVRDRDPIRAVIRATGCNQDGHTPGITQPSGLMQERLIGETYRKAGLDMKMTRYFEAHGTGTAIGDPTESSAIGAAFAKQREDSEPLYMYVIPTPRAFSYCNKDAFHANNPYLVRW